MLVAPGTYKEHISFHGVDIVLRSEGGPEVTTIDGDNKSFSVAYFTGGETRACVLQGFTLTRGKGTLIAGFNGLGGGVFIYRASPTISGNVITENVADWGGGIFAEPRSVSPPTYSPLIIDNAIVNNSGRINAGGVGFASESSGEIHDNTITNNRAGYDGGGIWVLSYASGVIIEGNHVVNNFAGDHGGGICVASLIQQAMTVHVVRNVVVQNVAGGLARTEGSGGGIFASWVTGDIVSNTLVANEGRGSTHDFGGGLDIASGGDPTVELNIIALSTDGGGIHCEPGPTPTFRNNLVWGNQWGDGVAACPAWFSGNGNIQADPRFCSAATGDYSLPPDSPAMTHPAGPLGALVAPGCANGVAVRQTTWSVIKALYGEVSRPR